MVSVPGSLPEAFSLAFCRPGCCWPVFLSLLSSGLAMTVRADKVLPACSYYSWLLSSFFSPSTAIRLYLCIPFMPPLSGAPC